MGGRGRKEASAALCFSLKTLLGSPELRPPGRLPPVCLVGFRVRGAWCGPCVGVNALRAGRGDRCPRRHAGATGGCGGALPAHHLSTLGPTSPCFFKCSLSYSICFGAV